MKLPLLLVLILFSVKFLFAQQTALYIVGTVHEKSKDCTAKDIYAVLNELQPDVILLEMDSTIYGKWVNKEIKKESNESKASLKYKKANADLEIRPFDMPGSVEYLYTNKALEMEMDLELDIGKQYMKGRMSTSNAKLYEEYLDLRDKTFQYKQKLPVINSTEVDALVESIEGIQGSFGTMIRRNQFLNKYKEFYKELWLFNDRRNNTMVENIIDYTQKFEGKRIVVLVGYTHRYFLLKELKKKKEQYAFDLKNAFK